MALPILDPSFTRRRRATPARLGNRGQCWWRADRASVGHPPETGIDDGRDKVAPEPATNRPPTGAWAHMSNMDEWPDTVTLPAGTYNIVAESTGCGLVTVPVVIANGKTTTVHLDGNWSAPSKTPTNNLVFLPDGEAVGWSGSITKSSE